jgi:DNA repair photolyase
MKAIYKPKRRAGEYAHLAVNLYTGCPGCCYYCYVPRILPGVDREIFHKHVTPRKGILGAIQREGANLAGTSRRVFLCFTCDPYPNVEKENGITRLALTYLKKQRIPFAVSTKFGSLAMRDFDLYGPDDMFGVTLTTAVDEQADEWEPGADLPGFRMEALAEAKRLGIRTWVSLEPVIDTEQSLDVIRRTIDYVDHYRIGGLNYEKVRPTAAEYRIFGIKAIELCEKLGKSYWIKGDLAPTLNGITYKNTDLRRANVTE